MTNALKLSVPEGCPFIDYEREFDFPVADVFRAHKEPDLVVQWLGPRRLKMEIDHYDFRTGGSYRYTPYRARRRPYGFRGSSTRSGRTSSPCRPSSSTATRTW